jgi:hypothetical protein
LLERALEGHSRRGHLRILDGVLRSRCASRRHAPGARGDSSGSHRHPVRFRRAHRVGCRHVGARPYRGQKPPALPLRRAGRPPVPRRAKSEQIKPSPFSAAPRQCGSRHARAFHPRVHLARRYVAAMDGSDSNGTQRGKYGDWRDAFSGSSSSGLICRECHALVAWRKDHPRQHLAWHQRLASRGEPSA